MSKKPLETLHKIGAADGTEIALWKIFQENIATDKHIFLTHGTFSDRRVCMGIASFMVERGYTCWIMEWRGHGASETPAQRFNFETIAKEDFLAVFTFLFQEIKIEKLDCITHSGGGICLAIFLIENPSFKANINTISLFGCQAFGAAYNWLNYSKILLGKYLGAIMGFIPARRFGRPHDESYYTMKQWYNWNLSGSFLGDAGKDYKAAMSDIQVPVFSVCAKGDDLIAPWPGCEAFLAVFGNPANRLLYCAKEAGFLEDYDHSRILHSSSAKKEIWPLVLAWMKEGEQSHSYSSEK